MLNALILADEPWRLFKIFGVWQLVGIGLLVALIIFWLQYRKRQM